MSKQYLELYVDNMESFKKVAKRRLNTPVNDRPFEALWGELVHLQTTEGAHGVAIDYFHETGQYALLAQFLAQRTDDSFVSFKTPLDRTYPLAKYDGHGFTCPRCASHQFATINHPRRARIGVCKEPSFVRGDTVLAMDSAGGSFVNTYMRYGCGYTWLRTDPIQERIAIHQPTRQEYGVFIEHLHILS